MDFPLPQYRSFDDLPNHVRVQVVRWGEPIRVTKNLRKPQTTFAMFEKADERTKMMEAP